MPRRVVLALLGSFVACAGPAEPAPDTPSARELAGTGHVGSPAGTAPAVAAAAESSHAVLARDLVGRALNGRAYTMLQELCATAPARLSGSPNAAKAVEWGLATMHAIGLQNVRAEPVMVPHWVRGAPERCERLDADGSVAEQLDVLALGGSIATPDGGIEAALIRVRSFEELQQRAAEARGKIVLFDRPMPRAFSNTFMAYGDAVPQRTSGASEAAKVGAVFALVRSMTTRIDDAPHTGAMRYEDGVARVPTAAISTLDADALAARIAAGETVRLRIEMHCETLPDVESANVVGEIVGAELPDEIVVVGGHLDSWDVGQGAHDDGAGCVHALEAARLLIEGGVRPRRTIRVVLFMNEENGLRGGKTYAEQHAGERHVAAVESDRGGLMPSGFTTSLRDAAFDALRPLVAELTPYEMGALLPGGGGADIGPLAAQGAEMYGLATISHRYFDYHHSANDVVDNVNERELALGAAATAYLLAVIAER